VVFSYQVCGHRVAACLPRCAWRRQAGKIRSQEPIESLGHLSGCWFRALNFVSSKLFELVIRDSVQDAPVHVEEFRKRIAFGGLGLMQFLGKGIGLSIGAKNTIELPPPGNRKLLPNRFYYLGGFYALIASEVAICLTTVISGIQPCRQRPTGNAKK